MLRHRLQDRGVGGDGLGEVGLGGGQVRGAQGRGAAGPVPHVGVRPGWAEPPGQVTTEAHVGGQEGVGESQVHPPQQLRVRRGVAATGVVPPADRRVQPAHPGRLAPGQLRGAERAHHQPPGRARQACPRVLAVVRVPHDAGQGERVGPLAEQRRDPADQGGQVAVDPPDHAVGLEPARPLADVRDVAHPLRGPRGVAGHAGPEAFAGDPGHGRQGQHPPSVSSAG